MSWKTTLFGIIAAASQGITAAFPAGSKVGAISQVASMVSVLLLGWFAKDRNVTGGTTPNVNSAPPAPKA